MPEPSSSTGAEPSAEAKRAAQKAFSAAHTEGSLRPLIAVRAAYRIDAPAIHAAGRCAAMDELREARFDASVARGELDMAVAAARAAGRDEALREVVAFVREAKRGAGICGDEGAWLEAADAITRRFGVEIVSQNPTLDRY
jgi:hypothetical protein